MTELPAFINHNHRLAMDIRVRQKLTKAFCENRLYIITEKNIIYFIIVYNFAIHHVLSKGITNTHFFFREPFTTTALIIWQTYNITFLKSEEVLIPKHIYPMGFG